MTKNSWLRRLVMRGSGARSPRILCWACVCLGLLVFSAPAIALPEGRQWELVSPANKHGVAIESAVEGGGVTQASATGNAITYITGGPPVSEPSGNRALELTQIFSRRGAGGWETQDIATPNNEASGLVPGNSSEYKQFAEDLSSSLVEPKGITPLPPLSPGAEKTIYLRESDSGSYVPLVTAANVVPGAKFGEAKTENVLDFLGASPDMKHIVFESQEGLTKGVERAELGGGFVSNLYEWNGGALSLVSVLPNKEAASKTKVYSRLGLRDNLVRNAVSTDGSKIVWSAHDSSNEHLYLRDMSRGETVQLDAITTGSGRGPRKPSFRGASADGTRIFFTDEQELTSDSRSEEFSSDLYVYEVAPGAGPLSGTLTDLTKDTNTEPNTEPEQARVQGTTIGNSEDGTYVYFVARGVLAAGASSGAENLYVDHLEGGKWSLRFVAGLSEADNPDWDGYAQSAARSADLTYLGARVSPSGEYLAFMSKERLTGYDNEDASSGEPDEEVFVYDARTQHTVCASCAPSGARPAGVLDAGGAGTRETPLIDGTEVWTASRNADPWLGGFVPGWVSVDAGHALYQPRYLLDSGQVFFDSTDDLVPAAVNDKENVYEYRPAGAECSATIHSTSEVYKSEAGGTGCVSLLSSGTSTQESAFLDASASGEDVFFLTTSRLAPQDTDEALDVYDAHVCSAAVPCPSATPTTPTQPCSEEASCRNGSSPAVALGLPTSSTFSGAGNIVLPPVAKVVPKPLTTAQKLAKALKACKKDKNRAKRVKCEAKARHSFHVKAKRARR